MSEDTHAAVVATLHVRERHGRPCHKASVASGFPLPRGACFRTHRLQLCQENGPTLPAQWDVLALWPDNSIKWCLLRSQLSLGADEQATLGVHTSAAAPPADASPPGAAPEAPADTPPSADPIREYEDHLEVCVGKLRYRVDTQNLQLFGLCAGARGLQTRGRLVIDPVHGAATAASVTRYHYRRQHADGELLAVEVTLEAEQTVISLGGREQPLKLCCTLRFAAQEATVACTLRLHNPAAAHHPHGRWDLGDPNSLALHRICLQQSLPGTAPVADDGRSTGGVAEPANAPRQATPPAAPLRCLLRLAPEAAWQHINGPLALCQWSSGGEQWQSPVHCDASGSVPVHTRGYTLHQAGELQTEGLRASPALGCWHEPPNPSGRAQAQAETTEPLAVWVQPDAFWEQFPSALRVDGTVLGVELFAAGLAGTMELQPGERKTWRVQFAFLPVPVAADGSEADEGAPTSAPGIATPRPALPPPAGLEPFPELCVTLDPAHVARCQLADVGDPGAIDARLLALIDTALCEQRGFLAKREQIDEYGWRHFGELYADHENDIHPPGTRVVSHYNNQYDPLLGLLRQYLLRADARWATLAQALADHVKDIDIYHTEADRPEYNHGLFWHTDHYLDAHTATHRAYSRHQPADAYDGHAGGGGPGGQHCYTGGLLLHYLLTGDTDSRDAVYALRDWISRVYEGSGTLVEVLLSVRNRGRRDLKNQLTGRYPLDRGTGNYLNALLDTYMLDQKPGTLEQVEWIIHHTVHPADDLNERALEDVEANWYYTVFLQAVCRYLQLKRELCALDEAFTYARDALLHYVDWMLAHERPYLDKPEILEFPNQTWSAQDLRKANLFFHAAELSPDNPEPYIERGSYFVEQTVERLRTHPTLPYTRILVLLMQNLYPSAPYHTQTGTLPQRGHYTPPKPIGPTGQLRNLLCMSWQALRNMDLKAERAALLTRFPAVRRLRGVG